MGNVQCRDRVDPHLLCHELDNVLNACPRLDRNTAVPSVKVMHSNSTYTLDEKNVHQGELPPIYGHIPDEQDMSPQPHPCSLLGLPSILTL
jgi:hypothetical protein